jgi:hypothetical protein
MNENEELPIPLPTRLGTLCPICKTGRFHDGSMYDSIEDMLTCDNGDCRVRMEKAYY